MPIQISETSVGRCVYCKGDSYQGCGLPIARGVGTTSCIVDICRFTPNMVNHLFGAEIHRFIYKHRKVLYTNKRLYHTTYTCENIHWVKIHNLCENTQCICKIHIMCEVTYRVPGDEYQLWACWGILAKGNNGRQIMKRKRNHVSHLWIGIVRKRFCLRDPFFEDEFFLICRRIFLIFWKNFPNLAQFS